MPLVETLIKYVDGSIFRKPKYKVLNFFSRGESHAGPGWTSQRLKVEDS